MGTRDSGSTVPIPFPVRFLNRPIPFLLLACSSRKGPVRLCDVSSRVQMRVARRSPHMRLPPSLPTPHQQQVLCGYAKSSGGCSAPRLFRPPSLLTYGASVPSVWTRCIDLPMSTHLRASAVVSCTVVAMGRMHVPSIAIRMLLHMVLCCCSLAAQFLCHLLHLLLLLLLLQALCAFRPFWILTTQLGQPWVCPPCLGCGR